MYPPPSASVGNLYTCYTEWRKTKREREEEEGADRGGEGILSQIKRQPKNAWTTRTNDDILLGMVLPGEPVGPLPPGTVSGWLAALGPSHIKSNSGICTFFSFTMVLLHLNVGVSTSPLLTTATHDYIHNILASAMQTFPGNYLTKED